MCNNFPHNRGTALLKIILILIDYIKTFDIIYNRIFWAMLHFIELDESVNQLFRSYLFETKQRVNYNKIIFDYGTILRGVAQGSILGPD